MSHTLQLQTEDANAVIDPGNGGRLASLTIGGDEILVGMHDDPLQWGCYPMVPFAGRIRQGILDFDGVRHQLPPNLGHHAIHGYGFVSAWEPVDGDTIEWEFAEPWPFRGRARQRFVLRPGSLRIEMTVDADDRQPITIGWHPWFLRHVGGVDAVLGFAAAAMYELDDEIPTGRLIEPSPRPWDNCFTGLTAGPRLEWGALAGALRSSAGYWVVYDEPAHALCVEPQSGPPNEVNSGPRVLEAGESTRLEFTIDWSSP